MVCRSSVSACSPYIPDASEPVTLCSQRVWCDAQRFQRHLWEFVAFFGLNRSTSGLTTTFGYSPLGIASNSSYLSVLNSYPRYSVSSAGFLPPRSYVLIYLPFLPRFSTSPAHASCGNLCALSASTPPPFPLLYPSISSAILRLRSLLCNAPEPLATRQYLSLLNLLFPYFRGGRGCVRKTYIYTPIVTYYIRS